MLKTLISACVAAMLAACGGGGSEGGTATVVGPLTKYAGKYSFCSGAEKITVTLTVSNGGNDASMQQQSEYFALAGCAGAVVGLETYSTAVALRYLSTAPAQVHGYPAANSVATFAVDRVQLSSPPITTSLTGTGVSVANGQTCVTHGSGRTCIDSLQAPRGQAEGGLFFTDLALVTVNATATGYERDLALPR